MSRLFVGQRVRIVGADSDVGRPFIGREAVVVETMFLSGWEYRIYGLNIRGIELCSDGWAGWVAENLEPIVPDGHRACDEEFKRDLDKLLEGMPA